MKSKLDTIFKYLFDYGNYETVLIGLRNTVIIAVCGLLIGIVIGSFVAALKVAGGRNKIVKAFCYVGDSYS